MVLFKEFGILNSYTIESTFYGGNPVFVLTITEGVKEEEV